MRAIVRFIVGVLAVIGLGSLIAIGFFFDPTPLYNEARPSEEAEITFVRLSLEPVQQEALFSTPCDPGGPHLYLGDGKDVRLPLFLRWPGDLPDIEDSDYAAPGNRFLIEGYPVVQTTGEDVTPALHFDVIAWSPMPPYRIWKGEGDGFGEEADVTEPVTFRSTLTDPIFETAPNARGGC